MTEQKLKKIYKELFYQAEYILKKDGVLALIAYDTGLVKDSAGDKMRIADELAVSQGMKSMNFLIFKKK